MAHFLPWLRRIGNSISLLTFCIAFGFGLLAVFLAIFRPNLLEDYPMLAITDTENIKFILTFTIGGIFTLTIFSYTMVMDVLNRSISNYSPRLIPLILREKQHQIILGVTSGTLIYALIMSIFVSSTDNVEFPSIAAPLAICMGIVSVLLFIYFIHGISQSIQVNYILRKSFEHTKNGITELSKLDLIRSDEVPETVLWKENIALQQCGYFNKIRFEKLVSLSRKMDVEFKLLKKMGSFVLENEPVLAASNKIDAKYMPKIKRCISIDRAEAIDVIEIGFKHLVEAAVKASSPAINDPGTALTAIDYLTQLFILRKQIPEFNAITSSKGGQVYFDIVPFKTLFDYCFREMKAYMEDDPLLMEKLAHSRELILGEPELFDHNFREIGNEG